MTARCRLARTASNAHALPEAVRAPDPQTFRRLQSLIRRYLSPATATVLAEPVPIDDGSRIDWFTPLGGHPVRLPDLSNREQQPAKHLLETRLHAIRELARRLPELEPDSDDAKSLLQATAYPNDDAVFVVGGQPVITFWSYGVLPVVQADASVAAPPSGRRARRTALVVAGLSLLGLSGWAAFHFDLLRWPPWGPDYAALLATERAEGEHLRRALLDRQGELAASLGQCALQDQVDALRRERALLAARRAELAQQLQTRLRACGQP